MAGLYRDDSGMPEGKFPIVLRRDGTPVKDRYFVLVLRDPNTRGALLAYAEGAEARQMDPKFVEGVRQLAEEAGEECRASRVMGPKAASPDAPPSRKDDPGTLIWARSIGCPGG